MSIAPSPSTTSGLRVRTRPMQAGEDLLDVLPSPEGALAWVHGGDGLVGWGEVARLRASGPNRFATADLWWRSFVEGLEVRDEVGLPGTGPIAFLSMAFADRPGHSVLIVPRVVAGRRDSVAWITEIEMDGDELDTMSLRRVKPVRRPNIVRYAEGELPVTGFRRVVGEAVERMRAGELDKVVLAHDLVATADEPVDPRFLLHGLAAKYPSCWVFAVEGLVGATPELLLRRQAEVVRSRVLAGTSWPHPGTTDQELAEDLLASAKDREEHAYAVESLRRTLAPFCTELTVPDTPIVLRLPNVLHLTTDVAGCLSDPQAASLLRLAEAVHPTAAVGGTPTAAAVRVISELEGMDRGRYAGPVGWIDAVGNGELGIALRCAQVDGNAVRLFAGCGVVAGSDPDTEVAEAAAKLVPVRDALERTD